MPRQEYRRRRYHRATDFWRDLRVVVRDGMRTKEPGNDGAIDRAFQERLMLAVTEVNGCRYCAYAHARMALAAGLTRADVDALMGGSLEGSPSEQVAALLYAQHWAETDAQPEVEIRQRIIGTYGHLKTEAIERSLRAIRMANLLGNTWDYLLHRVSLGRWGGA